MFLSNYWFKHAIREKEKATEKVDLKSMDSISMSDEVREEFAGGVQQANSWLESDIFSVKSMFENYAKALMQLEIGDELVLGSYYVEEEPAESRMNGYVKAPIRWKVIEKRGTCLLLLSKYILTCTEMESLDWKESGPFDFLKIGEIKFFTNEERKLIKKVKDMRLFLLDLDELPKGMDLATESLYVYKSGKETLRLKYDPYPWWLLRSGTEEGMQAYVDEEGTVQLKGMDLMCLAGVRPAMWIDVNNIEQLW